MNFAFAPQRCECHSIYYRKKCTEKLTGGFGTYLSCTQRFEDGSRNQSEVRTPWDKLSKIKHWKSIESLDCFLVEKYVV